MADAVIANLPSKINCNCGVYRLIDRRNGKFYVGSSKNLTKRKTSHLSELQRGVNKKLIQEAFDAGARFEFEVLINCEESTRHLWEQDWIDRLDPPLNSRKNVARPSEPSPETRAKLSANNPSKRPEVRAKISANNPSKRTEVRVKMSTAKLAMGENNPAKRPEVRVKISAACLALGENHPMKRPEVAAKISAARKAYWAARREAACPA